MLLIQINDLEKTYNANTDIALTVLKKVSLSIEAGEFVAIIGSSGSGKSTLMHILGFLDTASAGNYIFEDQDMSGFSEEDLATIRNEKIGFVFQSFHLLPRTTALENVQIPMIYAGVSEAEQIKRGTEALTAVGLGDRIQHFPNELSGGQKQRVAIARALINNPRVILADEPTGNLDTTSSNEIISILKDLNKKGTTVVVVTHEDEVAAKANRVIEIRDGKIIMDRRNKKKK